MKFQGFEEFNIKTQSSPDVSIHGIVGGGSGPALVLLHGFPQTHHMWHRVIPQLGDSFKIIALDLRGYGASSRPVATADYAKSVMARDIITVLASLQIDKFYVCAHDRGARVAHKLLVDYPNQVLKAIFLDICPTLAMFEKTDMDFAKLYWHWFFLSQGAPLPETMIGNDPRRFAELLMGGRYASLQVFGKEAWEEYMRVLEDPEAVHAMCEDYRAAASIDLDEARADIASGKLIKTPLKVLWGKFGVIERCFDAMTEWRGVTEPGVEVTGAKVDCGHYIPEEAPEYVAKAIQEFFV